MVYKQSFAKPKAAGPVKLIVGNKREGSVMANEGVAQEL